MELRRYFAAIRRTASHLAVARRRPVPGNRRGRAAPMRYSSNLIPSCLSFRPASGSRHPLR